MRIAEKRWFTVLLQWLITITMAVGALIILALPLVTDWIFKYYEMPISVNTGYYITCLIILYPSGFLGMAILYQSRKLMKKVNEEQPFILENVKRIKNVARLSAVLCVIYAIAIFFMHSVFTPILFVIFGLIALFLSVFGELFAKAVEYKDANDLTI